MTHRLEACAKTLSIAILFIATVAPAAHAQVQTNGVNAGMQPDNTTAAPAARTPLLTYGVDAGVGESDNVTLVSTDKVSQTIATADADITVKEQSRLLDVNATGNFSYFDYLQNAYSSQLLGRFDGVGSLAIVPGRLTWVVHEDWGQAAIDPYTPVTPNNLEDINYFSTGPDLFMRISGINFINLSALYARAQFETSPFNSNRLLGSIAAGRDMSAGSTVSLNGDFERVMFENTIVNTDFNRSSGYARYELHGARTDFVGDFGATTISQAGSSTTGALAKVLLSRKVSAAAKVTVAAGRELTDAGSSFGTRQSGAIGLVSTATAVLTSASYTRNFASVIWQYARNRTTFRLSAKWEKDTYPSQPLDDVTTPSAEFSVERRLTRAFSAELIGRLYKTDYINAAVATANASSNYETGLIGGALVWRGGRALEIKFRYEHNSWIVTGPGSGYGENRAFLTVGYRPRSTPEPQEPQ